MGVAILSLARAIEAHAEEFFLRDGLTDSSSDSPA
jgi:hypothetical protein